MNNKNLKPKFFILDVDGVLTNGQFIYNSDGKVLKVFGPDDHDALNLLKNKLDISFVTGDKKGFSISKKRIVDDMHYPLEIVSTNKRVEWLQERFDLNHVIYMGDGIFDNLVMRKVFYSIAPANASILAKNSADYITNCSGGDRAVAEACFHILDIFFKD
jgi:3-deoxy-D-manno-octulosonate 8-phosphate phosphatase (KDO 8-P phosphatase)